MRAALLTPILLAVPRAVFACPVCFGQSDSPLANATNMGILMMLGVVAVVLGSFGSFFIYLNRHAKQLAAGTSGPADTRTHTLASTNPQEGTAQC